MQVTFVINAGRDLEVR